MSLDQSQRNAVMILADALLEVRLGVEGANAKEQHDNTYYYAHRLLVHLLANPKIARELASVLVGHDQRILRRNDEGRAARWGKVPPKTGVEGEPR